MHEKLAVSVECDITHGAYISVTHMRSFGPVHSDGAALSCYTNTSAAAAAAAAAATLSASSPIARTLL